MDKTLRAKVADLPTYWRKPGEAITRIADILWEHGVQIVGPVSFNDAVPEAHHTYLLQDRAGRELNSMLVFAWYRLRDGMYEITAYLS